MHNDNIFASSCYKDLSSWVEEISQWENTKRGDSIFQFEMGRSGGENIQLARVENFLNYHQKMKNMIDQAITRAVSDLWEGEETILFKEKINFKLPGGGGFLAHQDSVAYRGLASHHISVMIAVDAATHESK